MLDTKNDENTSDDRPDTRSDTQEGGNPTAAAPFFLDTQAPKTAVISKRIRQQGIGPFFRRPKRSE